MRPSPLILVASLAFSAAADIAEIEASKDNTLYEDSAGLLSNGAGEWFFAGQTFFSARAAA
jgi:hypothetical protein